MAHCCTNTINCLQFFLYFLKQTLVNVQFTGPVWTGVWIQSELLVVRVKMSLSKWTYLISSYLNQLLQKGKEREARLAQTHKEASEEISEDRDSDSTVMWRPLPRPRAPAARDNKAFAFFFFFYPRLAGAHAQQARVNCLCVGVRVLRLSHYGIKYLFPAQRSPLCSRASL